MAAELFSYDFCVLPVLLIAMAFLQTILSAFYKLFSLPAASLQIG